MGFLARLRARRTPPPRLAPPGAPAGRFAVVDVETTGLDASAHRALEIAVVETDTWGRITDEWTTRLDPEGPVGATHVHGITAADVAGAPRFTDVASDVARRLRGAVVVGHHARFDLAFLRMEFRRAGWDLPFLPTLCTLEASTHHLPHLDRRRLVDCCWAVGVPLHDAHSALGDARATAGLLAAFLHPNVGLPPLQAHLALPAEALRVVWPPGAVRAPGEWSPEPAARLSSRARHQMARAAAAPPAPTLMELVERFSLSDALEEGAPLGSVAYLEKLAEVLEDGEITTEEAGELASVAEAEDLGADDVAGAHRAFVVTLALAALDDGKVTRAERAELLAIAELLGVEAKLVAGLLERAEQARHERLSLDLGPLPLDWMHGDPVRVGDRVVFTGCDDTERDALEARSTRIGVRVLSSVSAKTAMLVTDGAVDGTKAARGRELGVRIVPPGVYSVLLDHLQPALPRDVRASRPSPNERRQEVGPLTLAPPSPSVIRAWARSQGMEVGVRGRIPHAVVSAYAEAHPD